MAERTQADEGWAPMHGTQRTFHYYVRDTPRQNSDESRVGELRALCGKWMIPPYQEPYLLPLSKYEDKPVEGEFRREDCTTCSRKLIAHMEKQESI